MIDLTKKYRTRDGREVTGLRKHGKSDICGWVGGIHRIWNSEGSWYLGHEYFDLIPVEDEVPDFGDLTDDEAAAMFLAWRHGAVIEKRTIKGEWFVPFNPAWNPKDKYRIKRNPIEEAIEACTDKELKAEAMKLYKEMQK